MRALQLTYQEQVELLERDQDKQRVTAQRSLKKEMHSLQKRLLEDSVSVHTTTSIQILVRINLHTTTHCVATAKARGGQDKEKSTHYADATIVCNYDTDSVLLDISSRLRYIFNHLLHSSHVAFN